MDANLSKILGWILILTPAYLVFVTPFTLFPWHFGKTAILQIVCALVFAAVLAVKSTRNFFLDFLKHNFSGFEIAFAAFLIITLIAGIFGINTEKSLWGDQSRFSGALMLFSFFTLYLLWRAFVFGRGFQKAADRVFGAAGFFVAATVLFQPLFPILGMNSDGWFSGRLSGIVGNPVFLASTIFLYVFYALAQSFLEKGKWRTFWIAAALVSFFALFLSGTRGAFVGIAAGVFFALIFLFLRKETKVKKIAAFSLAGIFIFGVLVYALSSTEFVKKNIPQLGAISEIKPGAFGASTRLLAWKSAFKAAAARPFLGWGPENFESVFPSFYDSSMLRFSFSETYWDKTHNQILEIAVGTGLAGLAAYLAFYFLFLKKIALEFRKKEKFEIYYSLIFAGFVGYFFQNLFLFDTPLALFIFFFAMASVGGVLQKGTTVLRQKTDAARTEVFHQNRVLSVLRFLSLRALNLCFVLAAALMIYFAFYNFRLLRASFYVQAAEDWGDLKATDKWVAFAKKGLETRTHSKMEILRYLVRDMNNYDERGVLKKEHIEKIMALISGAFNGLSDKTKKTYGYFLWQGSYNAVLGKYIDPKYYDFAAENFAAANKIAPKRQDVYFLMAKVALLKGDAEKAIGYNKAALDINPSVPVSHWFYALTLVAAGREDEGIKEIYTSLELGYESKDPVYEYLIDLYAKRKEYDKIVPLYEELIKRTPGKGRYKLGLAATYLILGQKDKVEPLLIQALETDNSLEPEIREMYELLSG